MTRLKTPVRVAAVVLAWLFSAFCWYTVAITSLLSTVRTYGSLSAETYGHLIGRFVGAFLLPLIGVTLYYRKRLPKPPAHRKVLAISALALLLSLFSFLGNHSLSAQLTIERASILAQEGAGLLPPSPDQTVWDASVRSFFADAAEFNRQYLAEVGALDQSALAGMYSTDSFRDREQMAKILSQLHATLAVDEKYSSFEPLFERMKARLGSVDVPDSVKKHFVEGFVSGAHESLSKRTETTSKEKACIQASLDLYEFALAKRSSYVVRKEKLLFRDADFASQFDLKMNKAETLRTEFLQAKENFEKSRKEGLGKLNLKPSDFGLPSEEPPASTPK